MRAIVCRAWGTVDDLTLEDLAPPLPTAGKLQPAVTHRSALEDTAAPIRLMTDRKAHGKLVVVPGRRGG